MPQVAGSYVVQALIQLAITYVVNRIVNSMQKKPTRVLQKVDVAYQGALQPRRRLYGNFRASGLDTMPAMTSGDQGKVLHRLLTLSDGEIESIDAVWLNNDRIPASDWSVVSGLVTAGTYTNYARIRPYLGTASQTADSYAMTAPGWGPDHRLDGIAYCYFAFTQNNEIYTQGAPSCLVEGKGAIVYDPRLDTSPGAHPSTSTYFAFTTNPALILADFLQWVGESAGAIDWSDVVSCANTCEESVTVPNGTGGTTTQDRFTCSVEVYAPQKLSERDDTIAMLARAMLGACWYSVGKWQMAAGVYSSPAGSIVDDDFLGDSIAFKATQARSSGGIYNKVRGSFTDEAGLAQPNGFPEIYSTTYEAEDGESIPTDVEFKTARTAYEAQRNAILLLRQSRNSQTIAAQMRWRCALFRVFDVVNVTCTKFGWSNQTCRITRMKIRQDFTVEMQLQKISSSDFTDPSPSEYTVPGAVGAPTSVADTPNAPRNLRATGQASAIVFNWDPPLQPPVGVLYRLYMYTSSTPFSSATQQGPDTPQTSMVVPASDTTVRYWWVVAVDPQTGRVSAPSPPSNGMPAAATSASAGLNAFVTPGSATVEGYTSSLTTPTVTVTPTGGTPGYTYATTAVSGGSGITTNNGTTASPSWTATGLAEGDVKSGTYRIRVTDSAAATYDVYVSVTISRLFSITLTNTTVSSNGGTISPPAVSSYTVTNTGVIAPSPGSSYNWLSPSGTPGDYDVRFTVTSGALSSGTINTWLQLNTSRQIQGVRLPSEGLGTSTQTVTVEIRLHASPFTVLATATVTLQETIT